MTCSAYPLTEIDSISPNGEPSKFAVFTTFEYIMYWFSIFIAFEIC